MKTSSWTRSIDWLSKGLRSHKTNIKVNLGTLCSLHSPAYLLASTTVEVNKMQRYKQSAKVQQSPAIGLYPQTSELWTTFVSSNPVPHSPTVFAAGDE